MANLTRRPSPDHSPKLRELIETAPTGVRWKRESWVARRTNDVLDTIETRYFSAQTIGVDEARRRAIRWQAGKPVPERYDGIDLSRIETRRLILTRRITNEPTPIPRFELEIPSSRGAAEPWMRIYLGTVNTIDQERIDRAVATLTERLRRYRSRIARVGRRLAGKDLARVERKAGSNDSRLLCSDVLAWTGRGNGITFNPPAMIDPQRNNVYLPEMDAYLDSDVT